MKKAIIFLDFNGTIDDITLRGGRKFVYGLQQFSKLYNNNVDIVIITTSKPGKKENEVKQDIDSVLFMLPLTVREKFKFLIQSNNTDIDKIEFSSYSTPTYIKEENLSSSSSSKKEGVELFLQKYDKSNSYSTCVFVGDSETLDLPMIDANVGNREKYFILTNKRKMPKNIDGTYKVSLDPNHSIYKNGQLDIPENLRILQTSTNSYGTGLGLLVLSEYLVQKEKREKTKGSENGRSM